MIEKEEAKKDLSRRDYLRTTAISVGAIVLVGIAAERGETARVFRRRGLSRAITEDRIAEREVARSSPDLHNRAWGVCR